MSDIESKVIFGQGDNRWNACLNDHLDFSQLARYYLESANGLIERSVEDTSKLDVYVYSAVFLYRHSVELLLKDLIWTSNDLLNTAKTVPLQHNLVRLWQTLKPNANFLLESVCPEDFEPLSKERVENVETFLGKVTKYDPDSCSSRYPFDKEMKRTNSDIHHINVKNLYEEFNRLHEDFGQLSWLFEYLREGG